MVPALQNAFRSWPLVGACIYVLVMLAIPCMPVADTMGAAQAVPRWEYWMLHAAMPSAIWWQWTGELQAIQLWDRLPVALLAAAWFAACNLAGSLLFSLDRIGSQVSVYERRFLSILIGHSILSSMVFLSGWLIGTRAAAFFSVAFFALLVLEHFSRLLSCLRRSTPSRASAISLNHQQPVPNRMDDSFRHSSSRRLIGLLFVSLSWLIGIQLLGATLPTQDSEVRGVDWWIVKHSVLDGKLSWHPSHPQANAPLGFAMSSIVFGEVLTAGLPSMDFSKESSKESTRAVSIAQSETVMRRETISSRAIWNRRLLLAVLAGKTVQAALMVVGCLLVGVHLSRRFGVLPGLLVCFLLVSTPGIAELTRLGRTEALSGVWAAALLVIMGVSLRDRSCAVQPAFGVAFLAIVAGAAQSGYSEVGFVVIPASLGWIAIWFRNRAQPNAPGALPPGPTVSANKFAYAWLIAAIALGGSGVYVRNAIASGDPLYPWGKVAIQALGVGVAEEEWDALRKSVRPSTSVNSAIDSWDESESADARLISVPNQEASLYGWGFLWESGLRLFCLSNAHGLLLIPLAIGGLCLVRERAMLGVALWYCVWVGLWWELSPRYDRDWVGALFLLAWPAAAGAKWMLGNCSRYGVLALFAIPMVWSVVVVPIWPTSDNRILVGLSDYDQQGRGASEVPLDESGKRLEESYSRELNRLVRNGAIAADSSTILLIGETDDFSVLVKCLVSSAPEHGPLDHSIELTDLDLISRWRKRGATHVLCVWSGVRYNDQLTGRKREVAYRASLERMLAKSLLKSVVWELNSSRAELFQISSPVGP